MKMSKLRLAVLALIAVTVVYVAAFAGAWHAGISGKNIYAVGTVIFFMWYAVACYSAMKSEGMLKPELTRLRVAATILAITGGGIPAVLGGEMWVPYLLTARADWGHFYPWFGLAGFVLGMLIILAGIFIIRGKSVVGGNLAIWCGIANIFSGGAAAALEALTRFFPGLVAAVLGLALTILCPVLGGVLGLMSKGEQNETNQ